MKRISFICLLLSFILLLSAFAGCQKADIGEDESHSESVLFSLTKKELEKYSIVVPEGCDDSVFTIADQLGEKIKDITGKKTEIRIDLVVDGSDTYYIDNYEILLGYVNRPEAKQLYTSVRENDSGYAMVGKKIIIIGRNYTALKSSYNSFFRNVLYEADSKDVLLCEGMQKITSAEYAYNEFKLNGVSIEQYKIIYPSVNSLKEKSVAASMVAYILSRTGYTLTAESDKSEPSLYEIQIGATNRVSTQLVTERDNAGFGDNKSYIAPTQNGVWISGSTQLSIFASASKFYERIEVTNGMATIEIKEAMLNDMLSVSVNALTYNIYHNFTSNRNADHVLQSIEEQDADIFGCNEANTEWMDRLTKKFNSSYTCVKGIDSKSNTSGDYCPIFFKTSKYELVESGTKWLSDTPDKVSKYDESHTQRIITYAILKDKATGAEFMYIQAHLENNESGYNSAVARKKQSTVLKKFTDEYSYLPIIIGGDCNTTSITDLSPLLTGTRFANSSAIAEEKKESGTWVGSAFLEITGGVLDYFFVSGDSIAVKKYEAIDNKIEGKYPSDHIPVRINAVIYC